MVALLAGCASAPSTRPAPQPQASRPARALPGAVSPATYVSQAASIDLFVVKSCELVPLRSVTPALRAAAEQLLADHRGTASQLSFAGRRLDLLPSASLLPRHQAMLDELTASSDFDRTFVRLQRSVHGQALALHSDYARRGSSPTLRPVAANAAAVEQRHLSLLNRL
jgi:putative membrane protein